MDLASAGYVTEVIRNMVLKFQYPNTYTSQLFETNIEEGISFAPLREIVKLLMYIHLASTNNIPYLTHEEILKFIFLDERITKNTIDAKGYLSIVQEIMTNRKLGKDNYENEIDKKINWPQYQRQSRELIRILTYASDAFVVKAGKIYLYLPNIDDSKYTDVLHFISSALLLNTVWHPASSRYDASTKKSYVEYMDMNGEVIIASDAYPVDTKIGSEIKVSNQKMDYLAAVRTKPFLLLAGISGTGKSRIVRKLAQATVPKNLQVSFDGKNRTTEEFKEERWTLQRPANFELIQVKPNWHNSMDVVGYLSNIPAPHYVFTPFINFIVRAMCHPEVPFFLCLDEMNLAPVEEYFAEFLSAIESRAIDKDGNYMTDPIIPPFKTYGDVKDENCKKSNVGEDMLNIVSSIIKNEMISDEKRNEILLHLEEKGITLPKNLIIVGTVNMDETTFSFSRKVLDRAMSIEMNEVDYSSLLFDTTDDDIKAIAEAYDVDADSTGDHNQLNQLLVDRHVEAKEVVDDLGGAADSSDARFVIDYLETINKLLDGTPFKLGYRAANEALIYLKSSMDFGNPDR
ncbi:MAG: hypothetical protein K2G77_05790, partial [Muribaculaceae bacterium]|nr:hypothetical protein [Muribaculaceae bacterium]